MVNTLLYSMIDALTSFASTLEIPLISKGSVLVVVTCERHVVAGKGVQKEVTCIKGDKCVTNKAWKVE